MERYVAYYRVSTQKQGESGLGLEAQKAAAERFAASRGGEIVESFTEIESGRKADRRELAKAIECARTTGAVLLVAKLDRLARNVAFTSALMEAKTRFVCCDVPEANELTINILAAVNQEEARRVSERTKAAIEAKKARGGTWGNPHKLTQEGRDKGVVSRQKAALENAKNRRAYAHARLLRDSGLSYRRIAESLDAAGFQPVRGVRYYASTVSKLLAFFERERSLA